MVEIVIFSWCLAIAIIAYVSIYEITTMEKLIKKFKAWLACITRADEVWIVYNKHYPDAKISILLVTYTQEDAIEYLNLYNKNNKESAWLTRKIVY